MNKTIVPSISTGKTVYTQDRSIFKNKLIIIMPTYLINYSTHVSSKENENKIRYRQQNGRLILLFEKPLGPHAIP